MTTPFKLVGWYLLLFKTCSSYLRRPVHTAYTLHLYHTHTMTLDSYGTWCWAVRLPPLVAFLVPPRCSHFTTAFTHGVRLFHHTTTGPATLPATCERWLAKFRCQTTLYVRRFPPTTAGLTWFPTHTTTYRPTPYRAFCKQCDSYYADGDGDGHRTVTATDPRC